MSTSNLNNLITQVTTKLNKILFARDTRSVISSIKFIFNYYIISSINN